jgi:guanylate kinase
MSARAPLIILSGPSGVGKSVVIARLLAAESPRLRLSVSATTRRPRDGEIDGRSYHFWTRARFEQGLRDGEFLEYAEVFGNYYGSLRREVQPYREQGIGVLMDIDVQGAAQVRRQCPDAVSIFLRPPSLEVLEQRLRARGTETEAAIQRRLQGARQELERAGEYDYQVINDALETAVADVRAILQRHFEGESHAG